MKKKSGKLKALLLEQLLKIELTIVSFFQIFYSLVTKYYWHLSQKLFGKKFTKTIWKIYFYCKWVTFCESTFLQSLTFSCVVDIRYSAEFSKFRLHKITGTISRDTVAENFDFFSHDANFFLYLSENHSCNC